MNADIKIPSNRNFGITIGWVLLAIGLILYNFYFINLVFIWILSLCLIILGMLNSFLLYPFNYLWFNFGILLSKILSPIVITFFFFVIFTPYSFLGRLISKDIRNFKSMASEDENTFWEKATNIKDFRKQY